MAVSRPRYVHELEEARPTAAPYIGLAIVGVPTVYLYWALVTLSIEGINNIPGTGQGGTVAFLVALMATPPLVWGACYLLMLSQFPRRVCSALYATALVLPLTLIALVTRVAMGGGF